MSGHSKWSTIKRKKGATDARRSKIFSRVSKEINIAVREGGSDPDNNSRLRLAIANARGVNMPKDNIERAINSADKNDSDLQEVTYEGYAPNGIALFIECMTDNHNRTISNIRSIFNRRGGSLGISGSVGYMFDRKGVFTISKGDFDSEEFELEIIDAGAEDIEEEGDIYVITTSLEDFGKVQKKLEEMKITPDTAELQRVPMETKKLESGEAIKILRLIEEFEELDDIQNVYHNLEITDELMVTLEEK
ncbi:MAG: transcriptional regulator [Bacteroides sp. SM23_62_1]|nr:MAG: transcriptional regulator [Bacteroides sp. SM23_62_1]